MILVLVAVVATPFMLEIEDKLTTGFENVVDVLDDPFDGDRGQGGGLFGGLF
jgi:hypothetical protein